MADPEIPRGLAHEVEALRQDRTITGAQANAAPARYGLAEREVAIPRGRCQKGLTGREEAQWSTL